MSELNSATEGKSSKTKIFFGGIAAIGIFAVLLLPSILDTSPELEAELLSSAGSTAEIIAITPNIGNAGDLVEIAVGNLSEFSEEESGIFFGEMLAEIDSFEAGENGIALIFAIVPQFEIDGEHPVKIVTPNELIESEEPFQFTLTDLTDDFIIAEPEPGEDLLLGDLDEFTEFDEEIDIPDEFILEDLGIEEDIEEIFADEMFFEEEEEAMPTVSSNADTPRSLQAESTPRGIELSWQGNAPNYRVYYSTHSGSRIHNVVTNETTKTLSRNLDGGQLYFFAVASIDSFGNEGDFSNEISAIFNETSEFEPIDPMFYSESMDRPFELSEEGPAETLLISILLAAGAAFWIRRKKLASR